MLARIALIVLALTVQAVAQTQIRSKDDLKGFGLCARIQMPDGRMFTYFGINQNGWLHISDDKGKARSLRFDKVVGAKIFQPEGGLCIVD